MSQFLEQYHKSVADLPDKLKEHFDEIRRLDVECMTKATIVDARMKEFVKNRKSFSKSEAESLHKEITVSIDTFIFFYIHFNFTENSIIFFFGN